LVVMSFSRTKERDIWLVSEPESIRTRHGIPLIAPATTSTDFYGKNKIMWGRVAATWDETVEKPPEGEEPSGGLGYPRLSTEETGTSPPKL
jgi:hypothetical protein